MTYIVPLRADYIQAAFHERANTRLERPAEGHGRSTEGR
jgi:hypothetical protein